MKSVVLKKLRVLFREFRRPLNLLQRCRRPWRALWLVIWPIPWRYALPHPAPVHEIKARPNLYMSRHQDEEYLELLPPYRLRDTPLRSLYRLYDAICAGPEYSTWINEESQYFYYQDSWRIEEIPDPKDPDPLRYAILASLVEAMVDKYNYKISLGLARDTSGMSYREVRKKYKKGQDMSHLHEKVPTWTEFVAPVPSVVHVMDVSNSAPDTHFLKRNIVANVAQLHSI